MRNSPAHYRQLQARPEGSQVIYVHVSNRSLYGFVIVMRNRMIGTCTIIARFFTRRFSYYLRGQFLIDAQCRELRCCQTAITQFILRIDSSE